jgi:4-hydroxy-3-polyprenylbenzoate decarboxylase
VLIAAREDDPGLSAHDVPRFLAHVLERLDLPGTCTS